MLLCVQACQPTTSTTDNKNTFNVEVIYRERVMLPPNAEPTLSLGDASQTASASKIIAKTESTINSAPPFLLALDYRGNTIKSTTHYKLRAVIRHKDALLFSKTIPLDPTTIDSNDVIPILLEQFTANTPASLEIDGA